MNTITLTLCASTRTGCISTPIHSCADERLTLAGDLTLSAGTSVALLTPRGDTLAHTILSKECAPGATIPLSTLTAQAAEYTRSCRAGDTREALLALGDSEHPIALIPTRIAQNPLYTLAPPEDLAPAYPTTEALKSLLAEMQAASNAAAQSATAARKSAEEAGESASSAASDRATAVYAATSAQAYSEVATAAQERSSTSAAEASTSAENAASSAASARDAASSAISAANSAAGSAAKAAASADSAAFALTASTNAANRAEVAAEKAREADISAANSATAASQSATSAAQEAADGVTALLQGKVEAAESAKAGAESAKTAAETAKTGAEAAQTAAASSATAAKASETAAAKSATDLAATAESVGLMLVKPGSPINIEQRDGAICAVRCMGQNRFMPACDGVYYSITSSNRTYFLDKKLDVVKRFDKTFGSFNYHDYATCGSGTLIVRDGLIWYTSGGSLNVVDWDSGSVLATQNGYCSVVHNGLSGNMVAVAANGLTACVVTYDQASGAIVAGEAFETGFPFTKTWGCRVHPFHMGKFVLVSLVQQYNLLGNKIYALDANDRFVEISADTDGDPILFNCTASEAGFTGDKYKYEYAAKNPAFYWFRSDNATDASGASFATFAMTNGLRIWRVNGTTEDGVPTFAKFGVVNGYPWQAASALRRIPVAISCGTRPDGSESGYFYGSLLSGSMRGNNKTVPHTIKATIPFSQTSSGGYHSSITIEETKSTNLYGNFPVCPLKGSPFSFGGNWDYNNSASGLMVDLRNALTF